MTRLGDFLQFSATNFITKVAQIFGDKMGYFEKLRLQVNIAVSTFWPTLEKMGFF